MAHDTKKSMLMSLPVRSVARLDHGNEDFCCNNYCFKGIKKKMLFFIAACLNVLFFHARKT